MRWQLFAMGVGMGGVTRGEYGTVMGMVGGLGVQGLDHERRRVAGPVRMAVVLRVVQGILELPIPVVARQLSYMGTGVGFVVMGCRSSRQSR